MPTLTSTFAIDDVVWVVDPINFALFHGTIIEVVLSSYTDNTNTTVDTVVSNILLDNDAGTLKSIEDYMFTDQADAMVLLASIIDSQVC